MLHTLKVVSAIQSISLQIKMNGWIRLSHIKKVKNLKIQLPIYPNKKWK